MEKSQERAFAYRLAKTLTEEEISAVSGGSAAWKLSHHMTYGPSGGGGPSTLDGYMDISIDW